MPDDPTLLGLLAEIDAAGTEPDGPMFDGVALARLSRIPNVERYLVALASDPGADDTLRFVAANALFERSWKSWMESTESRAAIARVMTTAMQHDRLHNRWGLPGAFVGLYGSRLLSLGDVARSPLREALNDSRLLNIAGSEAHTDQILGRFRVADLAGWLLSKLLGQAWPDSDDPATRDEAIRRLRELN